MSYKVTSVLFDVYNALGGGYQEKYYQRALAKEFKNRNIDFKEQLNIPLSFKGESIGRYFLDFLIEDKVVVEIKSTPRFYARDIQQVLAYLKSQNIMLGILANFGRTGLQLKRILKGNS